MLKVLIFRINFFLLVLMILFLRPVISESGRTDFFLLHFSQLIRFFISIEKSFATEFRLRSHRRIHTGAIRVFNT